MKKITKIGLLSGIIAIPNIASAHCPLCTIGAGALAVFAASIGVSSIVVGIFIGAFALALGSWISKIIKKEYIPYQKPVVTALIYLSTVIPIMPFIRDYGPLYIPWIGNYGTTYTIDLFLLGAVIGLIIMLIAYPISKWVTKINGKALMPYQGLIITFCFLLVVSVIIELLS
jgi:hypothetical protein